MHACVDLIHISTQCVCTSADKIPVQRQQRPINRQKPDIRMTEEMTFQPLDESASGQFEGYTEGLMRTRQGDWVLVPATARLLKEYKSMEIRPSDVWIVIYPKVTTYSLEKYRYLTLLPPVVLLSTVTLQCYHM